MAFSKIRDHTKVELNKGLIIAAEGFIELNDHSVD
jgi:hypothetical protein